MTNMEFSSFNQILNTLKIHDICPIKNIQQAKFPLLQRFQKDYPKGKYCPNCEETRNISFWTPATAFSSVYKQYLSICRVCTRKQ